MSETDPSPLLTSKIGLAVAIIWLPHIYQVSRIGHLSSIIHVIVIL